MPARRGLPSSTFAWLGWLTFVVYGSLVPLDFRPMPIGVAWQHFQHIPWLALGVDERADWVANAVLYLPLGFLTARLAGDVDARTALAAGIAALLFSSAVAVGVEFTQEFFPPRTVSQNDIFAEVIGSAVGVLLAPLLQPWLARIGSGFAAGGSRLGLRLFEIYAAGYVALAFFPYDLLLSWPELQAKAASGNWGWLFAAHPRGLGFTLLLLGVEVAMSMPIGAWLAWRWPQSGARRTRFALAGLALGLFVEVGQFFFETGVSQGASVLTRVAGVAIGAALWPRIVSGGAPALRVMLRRWTPLILLAYLPALAFVNGWLRGAWQGPAEAAAAWADVRLLPFYYHYYTSEAHAVYSLGSVIIMYLPITVLGWAWWLRPGATTALAGLTALVIELSKLFIAGEHQDPTNVLIAAAACFIVLRLGAAVPRSRRVLPVQAASPAPDPAPESKWAAPTTAALSASSGARPAARGAGLAWLPWVVLPAAAAWAAAFPAFVPALLVVLAVAGAAVWWRPVWALAIVPAAMPVLDLAPWSGRLYLDEFDLLCAVCLAIALARLPAAPGRRAGLSGAAFTLLAASLAISTLRGLWPLPPLDANSFAGYDSAWNALRIVKGAAWAWCFVTVFRRARLGGDDAAAVFAAGMRAGLLLTVACVVWERLVFVGLFDFGAVYRVSGPFSAMHKGGAYIECYLVVGAAFALLAAMRARRPPAALAAVGLLGGAGYALAVTYSRNGYAAMAVMLLVGLAAGLRWRGAALREWGYALAALLLALVVTIPVIVGPYARQRLSHSSHDLQVRRAHWADALALRDDDAATTWLGEGLGRFPDLHYWRSREPAHAASYQLARRGEGAGDRSFLRLGPGATLYIEQIVAPPAGAELRLSAQLRSQAVPARLDLALCEKWLLTSRHCDDQRLVAVPAVAAASAASAPSAPAASGWQPAEVRLRAPPAASSRWPLRGLVKLALLTPADGAPVEVTDLHLSTADGVDLLTNGDFSAGMDHWLFATDIDPPWHIHSLPVAVLFDQGWLGVIAWSAVSALALARGLRRARRRVPAAPAVQAALAGLAGFAVCASLNTLIDAPRFLWLLLVLLWLVGADDADAGAGSTPAAAASRDTAVVSGQRRLAPP